MNVYRRGGKLDSKRSIVIEQNSQNPIEKLVL